MANYANTIYSINGNEKDINLIAMAFDGAESIYEGLSRLDIDFESNDKFMGEIMEAKKLEDGSYSIVTYTKWQRNTDLENTLYDLFEDITIYYEEEEFGCSIFRTNDSSGEIFPERFYVDLNGEGEYFNTEQETLDYLNDYYGTEFPDLESVCKYGEEHDDDYICVLEIEVE